MYVGVYLIHLGFILAYSTHFISIYICMFTKLMHGDDYLGSFQVNNKPLSIVSYIGIGISAVCLFLTIIYFISMGYAT